MRRAIAPARDRRADRLDWQRRSRYLSESGARSTAASKSCIARASHFAFCSPKLRETLADWLTLPFETTPLRRRRDASRAMPAAPRASVRDRRLRPDRAARSRRPRPDRVEIGGGKQILERELPIALRERDPRQELVPNGRCRQAQRVALGRCRIAAGQRLSGEGRLDVRCRRDTVERAIDGQTETDRNARRQRPRRGRADSSASDASCTIPNAATQPAIVMTTIAFKSP